MISKDKKCAVIQRSISLILIIATILSLMLTASAETVIAANGAKVYQSASESAASVSIPEGMQLDVVAEKNGWLMVQRAGVSAFIPKASTISVVDCNNASGYVTEASAMYKKYGSSAKYGTLPVGTEVKVAAVAGDWAYVQYGGYRGFVKKAALSTKKPVTEAPETAAPETTVPETDANQVVTGNARAYAAVAGAKVYKSYSTSSKVICTLPLNTAVRVTAMAGEWCRVTYRGYNAYMLKSDLAATLQEISTPTIGTSPSEDAADQGGKLDTSAPSNADVSDSSAKPASGRILEMDWWDSDIQNIFARGTVATITDVATGISWKEVRKGGTNHADVQPCTAEDTAAMKAACGKWSWDRRAIIVTINGVNYAASMNCKPHGSGSIKNNNFDGHHCIHFTNSRTHSGNKVCSLHQAAIQVALKAKL